MKWARIKSIRGSVDEVLSAAAKVQFSCQFSMTSVLFSVQFKLPQFLIYRVVCEVLEENGRLTEAVECFRKMQNDLSDNSGAHGEHAQWEIGKGFQSGRNQD